MVRRTQGSAVVGLLLIAAAAAFPQQHPDGDRLAARLSTLNQQLKEPNVSLAILSQRVAALSELMRLDPRRAISLAVPAEEAAVLSRYGPVERQGEWHGSLEVVVEDNFSRRTSRTHVWMDAGGEKLELFLPDGAESLRSGQIATVRGIRLAHAVAADATDTIPGGTPCNPIGEQRVAVLLVDFPGAPLRPEIATLDDIRNLYFSTAQPSLSTYWREVSYGKTWATGDVFGPIHMVQNYHYPEQWQDVATAAIRAADSMTDLRNYTHIDILWPGTEATAETSGWDGQATLGCITLVSPSKGSFTAGRTVLVIGNWSGSPRFAGNLFLPAHEQGHHFALNHADTMAFGAAPLGAPGASGTFLEYGSLYSAMGNVDTSQPDFPAAHYDAPHKLALGWLQKGSGVVDVETNGFFRLPPIEKSAAGPLALRVRRGSGSNEWLWIEYRQPLGFDELIPRSGPKMFTGAMIHYETPDPRYAGHTLLLDFTPATTPGYFNDGALAPGTTWSDPYSPLAIRVDSPGSSGLPVTVMYGKPCTTVTPEDRSYTSLGGQDTVIVSADAACNWTAVSSVDWITVTGGKSGNGSGKVTYSVAASSSPASRSGSIVIGWTTFAITQAEYVNEPPVATAVVPTPGSGSTGTFQFSFADPNGAVDLQSFYVYFRAGNDSRSCEIYVNKSDGAASLLADDGMRWLGPVKAGSSDVLQNGMCGLDAAGILMAPSGNTLNVTLPLFFTRNFVGTWDVGAGVSDSANARGETPKLGVWTVVDDGCSYILDSASAAIGAAGGSGSVAVAAGPGCRWLAASAVPWIMVKSGASGSGAGTAGYTVTANTVSAPRVGSLIIAGMTLSVTQAGAAPGQMLISEGGVVNGASFQDRIASSTWITIRGTNLAPGTRIWQQSDFAGVKLPIQLDGVSVSVNGSPAYIYYISPGQINALAPDDVSEGPVTLQVAGPQGHSNTVTVQKQNLSPAFFLFDAENRKYLAAVHTDGTYLGKPGLYPGLTTRSGRPGEIITLFGTGFGAVDPSQPAGAIVAQAAPLKGPVAIRFGNVTAQVGYAGLVSPGLYQFNLTVPDVPAGDQLVLAEIGGYRTQFNAYITVER